MLNEGNQIHNCISSSGCDFLQVTVPVPNLTPRWLCGGRVTEHFEYIRISSKSKFSAQGIFYLVQRPNPASIWLNKTLEDQFPRFYAFCVAGSYLSSNFIYCSYVILKCLVDWLIDWWFYPGSRSGLEDIRHCIRRLRVEKKVHTLVLFSIFPDKANGGNLRVPLVFTPVLSLVSSGISLGKLTATEGSA